ncbi:hypothetical protein Bhyg_06375 [Pseudolycoriella hygida]|uniref:Uncharacterized protein n=1 Tax=Pseudolycoriella hygida TaxID=35572 RepID=A0A9Q0N272_9DIPT|nr:hypothetical protein Bhyg_06375 [Pseudolycoriella hygida]
MEVHFTSRLIYAWMIIHSAWAASVNVQPLNPSTKPTTENLSRQARDSRYYGDERPSGRCITCAYAYDRYDDRYGDGGRDRSYNQYYSYRPGASPDRGYGQSSRGGYDDRNWYYQPDYYDDRNRYLGQGVDRNPGYYDNRYENRYTPSRYDDRYNVRPYGQSGQYDRYNPQYGSNYRGNGYDNTDPNFYYEQSRRDPYGSRDRPNGEYDRYDSRGYNQDYGYDGYRSGNRGGGIGYDLRNFRPWDESYRGTSGFDNSGRGYYFANKQAQSPHSQPPPQPFRPPFTPIQNPPTQHNNPNHHPFEHNSLSGYNGKGTYNYQNGTGGVGNRGDDTSKGNANKDRNNAQSHLRSQEIQSAPYGSYERPLRGSYLFERGSDSTVTEASDSKASEAKSVNDNERKQ